MYIHKRRVLSIHVSFEFSSYWRHRFTKCVFFVEEQRRRGPENTSPINNRTGFIRVAQPSDPLPRVPLLQKSPFLLWKVQYDPPHRPKPYPSLGSPLPGPPSTSIPPLSPPQPPQLAPATLLPARLHPYPRLAAYLLCFTVCYHEIVPHPLESPVGRPRPALLPRLLRLDSGGGAWSPTRSGRQVLSPPLPTRGLRRRRPSLPPLASSPHSARRRRRPARQRQGVPRHRRKCRRRGRRGGGGRRQGHGGCRGLYLRHHHLHGDRAQGGVPQFSSHRHSSYFPPLATGLSHGSVAARLKFTATRKC